ncbi:MAG: endonuclease MutS2 [bacterium]
MAFDEKLLEFDAVRELIAARCVSDLGRRAVMAMSPSTDQAALEHDIALVNEMMRLIAARREPPIHELRDVTIELRKVARERSVLDPQELLNARDFCQTASHMRHFYETMHDKAPALHALAMPLYHAPALIGSIDEKIAPDASVRDSASELLQHLRADILATEQRIQRELTRLVRQLSESGDLQDNFFTLRNERHVLPVKSTNRSKVPGIIHDSSNTGETVFIEPFVILEESNKLADLRLSEREEIYRILLRVAGHIRDELNVLLSNLEILTEFDLIYGKARFGVQNAGAFPYLTTEDRPISLVDAHHPLIYAVESEQSRPLNFALDAADRVLVITGPNAGGKTTTLKTIGLSALMAQCAAPAPLNHKSHMPVFRNILADIGDEQNVIEGQSTFSAHMRRLVEILRKVDRQSLVLLDELGTATDPGEGGALAVAVLEYLSERAGLVIVSTHIGALKNWAHNHPHGRNASFRLSERDHRPTFRLTLDLPGISEALVVAEQAGLPPEIIKRARSLRPESEQDVTALILTLQEKEQRLSQEINDTQALRAEFDAEKYETAKLREQLREEKRTLRVRLTAEKEKAVREIKARVEALIAHQPTKQQLADARRELDKEMERVAAEQRELCDNAGRTPAVPTDQPQGAILDRLKTGDHVRVVSLNEEGIVQDVSIRRGEVRVFVRNMTVTVKPSDIELLPADQSKAAAHRKKGVHYKRPKDISITLDLHGLRVTEAINRIEKFMDDAILAGSSHIRLVHGHGSGALRRALHDHLRAHPLVKSYRYGSPAEGGAAVTIVELK